MSDLIAEHIVVGETYSYFGSTAIRPVETKVQVRWVDAQRDLVTYHHQGDPQCSLRQTTLTRFLEIVNKYKHPQGQ